MWKHGSLSLLSLMTKYAAIEAHEPREGGEVNNDLQSLSIDRRIELSFRDNSLI